MSNPTPAQIEAAVAAVCSKMQIGTFPVFGDNPSEEAAGLAAYNRGDAEVKISFAGEAFGDVLDISERGYAWRYGMAAFDISSVLAAWVRFDYEGNPYFAASVRLS